MNNLKNISTGEVITFSDLSPDPDVLATTTVEYTFSGIHGESSTICKRWRELQHIQDMEMEYQGRSYKLIWCMPPIGQNNPSQFILQIGSIDPN